MTPNAEAAHASVREASETSPFAEQFLEALEWTRVMRAYVLFGEMTEPDPVDALEDMKPVLMDIGCELIVRGFFMPEIPDWLLDPMGALEGWSDWLEKTGPHIAINNQRATTISLARGADVRLKTNGRGFSQ